MILVTEIGLRGGSVKQNITLTLDRRIIQAAKDFAARRGTSVSALLADELQGKLERQRQYDQSRRSALALLDLSFPLGGQGVKDRNSLHDCLARR
jgi:hypothetical protein